MDDTTASRASDAAATRKRRSSILKSQRPPRTPFSELEFHVTTPPDATKSRRVSFSRRTGVAEFATHEATTTWKNFYEEHNKSAESSGNDSGNTRQPLGHIAKGIFDQQFEEVEAVDFISTFHPAPNTSSSINYQHQLSLEHTDLKLTAPRNKFELSSITNPTNLFNDEHTARGEVTDRIDVNFSAIQNIDDLDEIQKDLQQAQNAHRSFNRQSMSEYIEVLDLNMTQAVDNVSDMSITDSVHIPKVQVVPTTDKVDWMVDKENIAVNPYVAPQETENFAINEESDKVLVFDGKRLTIQSEMEPKTDYRKTLLPNALDKPPQRKTIVLNMNDDLPNIFNDMQVSENASSFITMADLQKGMALDDMSITQPTPEQALKMSVTSGISNVPLNDKSRTILYEDDTGNISVTKAIPSNIINNTEKRRTIVYNENDGDMSITRAVASDIPRDGKTIVFEEKCDDISITQALPANIITNADKNKRRTVVFEDEAGNLSITQAVPNILITEAKAEKRRTIVYEDETGNISITQAIPSNIVIDSAPDRRRTVVFESDTGNISVTQAVPSNLILQSLNTDRNISHNISVTQKPALIPSPEKSNSTQRRTIVYENDTGNLSITQAVSNEVIAGKSLEDKVNTDEAVKNTANDRRTIIFNNDAAGISMTQAVSLNGVIAENQQTIEVNASEDQDIRTQREIDEVPNKSAGNKRKTIVFDAEECDISMTQAVPLNQIIDCYKEIRADVHAKRRTVVFEDNNADLSITQAVNINKLIPGPIQNIHDDLEDALNEALHKKHGEKTHRTIEFEMDNIENVGEADTAKRKTLVFEDNNISITQALPTNIFAGVKASDECQMNKDTDVISIDDSLPDIAEEKDQDVLSELGTGSEQSESILQNAKFMIPDLQAQYLSTPIPEEICEDISAIEDEGMYENLVKEASKGVSDVFVYQATTGPSTQKILTSKTEQSDSRSQVLADDEKMLSSSSKVVDNDEAETVESAIATEQEEQSDTNINEAEPEQITETEDRSQVMSIKSKNSVLNDLLDMSTASTDGIETFKAKDSVEIAGSMKDIATSKDAPCTETNSKDTLFYITKDGEEEAPDEIEEQPQLTEKSPLHIQYKEPEIVEDIENKLEQIKGALKEDSSTNRHYEKIHSSDVDKNKKERRSFKTANDTNELLEMLSDLTDKTIVKPPQLDPHLEEEPIPDPVVIKGHLALENKSESIPETKRSNFASRTESVVLSREDLNMSMARGKSRLHLDDSELESIDSLEQSKYPKKSSQMSRDVVKTLQFDDSMSVTENKLTPLKKTAFGETTYMQENKSKVIPDYLTASDGIKELMDDLVKPMADVFPFEAAGVESSLQKVASTCSTQIQANLVTSSQIDVNAGLSSRPDSCYDVNKLSSVDMINDAVNRSVSRALKSPIKSILTRTSTKSIDVDASESVVRTIIPRHIECSPGRVLIFDHNNPLNNVLLAPDLLTEGHKYNPGSTETVCVSERSDSVQISLQDKDTNDERVSTQYNVGSVIHSVQQSGDGKITESQSAVSNLSKPMSIDQSTDPKLKEVKDSEVNTVIAMKGNTELLEASSSLTLVDDALRSGTFDVNVESRSTIPEESTSPVKVIFTVKEKDTLEKLDSDFTSEEDDRKAKKRIYSPTKRDKHKHCTISSLDVTPKPISKMQKLSATDSESESNDSKKKLKHKKPGTSLTVQQLMTEYKVNIDHESLDAQIKGILRDPKSGSSIEPMQTLSGECSSVEMVSSCTSSKNLRCDSEPSASSKVSRMDWKEDVLDEPCCRPLSDGEPGANVVAKIDMLPFMGSHECEWESSSGDTWTFRLLHTRLRLAVRLAHRHDNATRSCVRADTRVLALTVEILPHDSPKNSVAAVCVNFAAETMRFFIGRGYAFAGEVPALVRRCAAAARLAARWCRIMREAQLRLAYTLTAQGDLTLKVANIPLRCVWEVAMRLELVVSDSLEPPWVRAGDVCVRQVLGASDAAAPPPRPPRSLDDLPRDWSHAPRAVWRIFKHFKNKTREDEELFQS